MHVQFFECVCFETTYKNNQIVFLLFILGRVGLKKKKGLAYHSIASDATDILDVPDFVF